MWQGNKIGTEGAKVESTRAQKSQYADLRLSLLPHVAQSVSSGGAFPINRIFS